MENSIHSNGGSMSGNHEHTSPINQRSLQLLIAMKIFLILLAISLHVSAAALSQQITLSVKKAPLREVMQSISKQSGYNFLFKNSLTKEAKPVTITLSEIPLEKALDKIFEDQPFSYKIDNKSIVISKKKGLADAMSSITDNYQSLIKGAVTDSSGKALIRATVILKEQKNKVSLTDESGNFSFRDAPEKGTLIISMIGFETKEVAYNKPQFLTIALKVSSSSLDEIRVIAYGTTTKRLSTSNISTIKASEIANQPVGNALFAVQGRVPGVYIEQSTGNAGGSVQVRIQGQNSIINGSDPFYVIDGVPFNSSSPAFLSSILGTNGGSALSFINPADIESIEILKDADATAIYGSRAANGAVLITTKKGVAGKTTVSLNMQTGIGKITRKQKLLNTDEYLELRKEAYFQNDKFTSSSPQYPFQYDINGTWDQKRYTDWQDELIGGTARYTDLQSMITGGSANTQFKFGAGYHKETSVYPGDISDTKGSVSYNMNHNSSNKKFILQFSGNYLHDLNKLSYTDITGAALKLSPNAPSLYTSDGQINWEPLSNGQTTFARNPIAQILNTYRVKSDNLLANAQLSYQILPQLWIKSSFGFNKLESNEFRTTPLAAINPSFVNRIRSAKYANADNESWIIEPQLTYNINSNFGSFAFLLGGSFQRNDFNASSLSGTGYNTDAELVNMMAASSLTVSNNTITNYRYGAFFGRINYNLNDKYLLNITGRRDGSSRFGSENLFHNFYSVGGAWIFSSENWLRDNLPVVEFGKLRMSYGTTGSDQIGDYGFLNLYSQVYADLPYQGGTGLVAQGLASPYIQWEETKKLNIGIDLNFFKNRLQFTSNYFRNRSSNQLLRYPLAILTGFIDVQRNIPAKVQNSGWEFQLRIDAVKHKKFTWVTNINMTLPANKLVSFPDLKDYPSYSDLFIIGAPITLKKVYQFAGVNDQTGIYQFYDANGKITSTPNTTTDKTEWIDLTPTFYGGWSNQIQFKGFNLDFLFQFVKQIGANGKAGTVPGAISNQPISVLDRWKNPGDIASIQKSNTTGALFISETAYGNSDAAYSDASFIRLKNISLSYNLSTSGLQKLKISQARFYLQAQNLMTITKYPGMDPETRNFAFLPPLRVISIGTQFTF